MFFILSWARHSEDEMHPLGRPPKRSKLPEDHPPSVTKTETLGSVTESRSHFKH